MALTYATSEVNRVLQELTLVKKQRVDLMTECGMDPTLNWTINDNGDTTIIEGQTPTDAAGTEGVTSPAASVGN